MGSSRTIPSSGPADADPTLSTTLEREALLPCPFCGASGDDLEIGVPHAQAPDFIRGANSSFDQNEAAAIAAWNRRT